MWSIIYLLEVIKQCLMKYFIEKMDNIQVVIENETPNTVEFVNAGGPHPVYKSHNKKKKADYYSPERSDFLHYLFLLLYSRCSSQRARIILSAIRWNMGSSCA